MTTEKPVNADEAEPAWRGTGAFLRENKRWWLLPFLVTLALVGAMVFYVARGAGGAAPFVYPVF